MIGVSNGRERAASDCTGCGGSKGAPIATVVDIGEFEDGVSFVLCEECGRDVANAVGAMCIRDGGWSRLEPRRRKGARR